MDQRTLKEGFRMMHAVNHLPEEAQTKPKRRIKKGNNDPIQVVQEAARLGDARFEYFVETGKLRRK